MILAMPTLPPPHLDELKTGTVPGPCKQARIGTRQLDDCLSHVVDMSDDAKLTPVTVTVLFISNGRRRSVCREMQSPRDFSSPIRSGRQDFSNVRFHLVAIKEGRLGLVPHFGHVV